MIGSVCTNAILHGPAFVALGSILSFSRPFRFLIRSCWPHSISLSKNESKCQRMRKEPPLGAVKRKCFSEKVQKGCGRPFLYACDVYRSLIILEENMKINDKL